MREKKLKLPEIEGVEIPRYVRQLANGRHNRISQSVSFGEMDEKLNVLQNELVSYFPDDFYDLDPSFKGITF